MAKVKGTLISLLVISHEVEFEIDEETLAKINTAKDEDGFVDHPARGDLHELVHKGAPKIDLNGGSYVKGDYEYDRFTLDGKEITI
jgi:hypothetical protein